MYITGGAPGENGTAGSLYLGSAAGNIVLGPTSGSSLWSTQVTSGLQMEWRIRFGCA